jgi:hypothetical protein
LQPVRREEGRMSVNLEAWDNFLGRSLIVFLMIEVRKTGSDIFIGEGPWPLVLSIVFGSLATAGLHRLKMAFERRSPSDPAWEAAALARKTVQ